MTLRLCFVWLSEQSVTSALYTFNKLIFITEVERVHCALRAVSVLNEPWKHVRNFSER